MNREVCEHFSPVDLPCEKCKPASVQKSTLREAAQQALKALGLWATGRDMDAVALNDLIFRLEAALAESVQEPAAWMHTDAYNPKNRHLEWSENRRGYLGDWIKTPLYAAPLQRKPLTEEEISAIDWKAGETLHDFARAIERAHGIGEKE